MKNKIETREDWRKGRIKLLKKEKAFTKLRDELSEMRRQLPWLKIEKEYKFKSFGEEKKFIDLFKDKSQLIVYHFMFAPNQTEGCKMCSFWADNFNSIIPHLKQRDVNFVCVSRGEVEKLEAFKKRMGWDFEWFSSENSGFNFDFNVSFKAGEKSEYNYVEYTSENVKDLPGISVFYKDENNNIFHTYSCYARELETFNTAYRFLDIIPKGRDEDSLPWGMAWVDYHDKYKS